MLSFSMMLFDAIFFGVRQDFLSESDLCFCLEVVPHLHHDHLLLLLGLVVDLRLGLLVGGVRRGGGSEDAWRRRSQRGLRLAIGT